MSAQVMSSHERLQQNVVRLNDMRGGPGNLNQNQMAEQQFNVLFTRKMAAEIVILVRLTWRCLLTATRGWCFHELFTYLNYTRQIPVIERVSA